MNLEEFKAQNAAEEAANLKTSEQEPVKKEEETVTEPVESENEETGEETEAEELPAFMDTGEQTPEDEEEKNDYVPLKTFKSKINKFKGEIKEKDEENERLRAERDELKNQTYKPVELKLPVPEEFDTDEEYQSALDVYIDARATESYKRLNHQDSQEAAQAKTLQKIEEGVTDHYSRVEKLCEKHKINPDTYKAADSKFRKAVEMAYPGNGELISDGMISALGEGSDAVVFHLGVNEAANNKLLSLLHQDPNGIKAAIYLGQLKTKLNKPGKVISGARAPSKDIKGDASTPSVSAAKKKYDAAHAKGEGNVAFEIKRKAKASGVDTSSW
jgi:hypothetical protein